MLIRTTIVLLFKIDNSQQPPAILQDDTSGEYYQHIFHDWRDAIHFLIWSNDDISKFNEWYKKYDYGNEKLNGNRNEFSGIKGLNWKIDVIGPSFRFVNNKMDINYLDAWNRNKIILKQNKSTPTPKQKLPRCPKGTRRNKKTGQCE